MIQKSWVLALLILMFPAPTRAGSQESHPHPHDDTLPDMEIKISRTGEVNLPAVRIDEIEII